MRYLWVLFVLGVAASLFVLSDLGEVLMAIMFVSIVGMPLGYLLMQVPLVTGTFGLVFVPFTIVRRLPWLRDQNGLALFGVIGALVAGTLYAVPLHKNKAVDIGLLQAVADDKPFSGKKSAGSGFRPTSATRRLWHHLCRVHFCLARRSGGVGGF